MRLFEVTKNDLSPLTSTNFQQEKLLERQDLQRLLKNKIEVIDPDILVIAEEFGDWEESGRRIDLLAVDKDANLVVIELKRTEDGGHMELQAIRYAAMVSNMTWDHASATYKNFLESNKIEGDSEEKMRNFFDGEIPQEDDFNQNCRIVLASGNFSKEITTSVLWLNDRGLDIRCVRLSLHKIREQLVLSSDQIIPLPEAESYQIEVRQKRQKERQSRRDKKDKSLISISYDDVLYEDRFKKSDIGYFTIKLLEEKNRINKEILEYLKEDTSCRLRLLKTREEMTYSEKEYKKYRIDRGPELIYNSQQFYVVRNWGIQSTKKFIKKMEDKFPEITYSIFEE